MAPELLKMTVVYGDAYGNDNHFAAQSVGISETHVRNKYMISFYFLDPKVGPPNPPAYNPHMMLKASQQHQHSKNIVLDIVNQQCYQGVNVSNSRYNIKIKHDDFGKYAYIHKDAGFNMIFISQKNQYCTCRWKNDEFYPEMEIELQTPLF
jgi:hypothetical protein